MSSSPTSSFSEAGIISLTRNPLGVSSVGDYNDPLYLHSFNSSNTTLISCVLTG